MNGEDHPKYEETLTANEDSCCSIYVKINGEDSDCELIDADFCRELERENARLREKLRRCAEYLRKYNHDEAAESLEIFLLPNACVSDGPADRLETMERTLRQLAECDLNETNCASLEVASKRIRKLANAALR